MTVKLCSGGLAQLHLCSFAPKIQKNLVAVIGHASRPSAFRPSNFARARRVHELDVRGDKQTKVVMCAYKMIHVPRPRLI
jgi:hypothetical protein